MPGPIRFTPEELQYLIDGKHLTQDDMAKMDPADQKTLIHLMAQNPDRGGFDTGSMSGEIMKHPILSALTGGALLGPVAAALPEIAGAASAGPIVSGLVSKVPAAVRGGVGSYVGYEAANKLSGALGLPDWMQTVLGLAGAHYGGGMGAGVPAAAEEAATSRIMPSGGNTGAPFRPTTPEKFGFAPPGGGEGAPPAPPVPPGEPPSGSSSTPRAVVIRRGQVMDGPGYTQPNANDYLSRVKGGGVQNDFKGPVSIQRQPMADATPNTPGGGYSAFQGGSVPSPKSSRFSEGSDGAQQLEELLDRIYGPDRPTVGNGTAPRGGGFDPREFPPGTNQKTPPKKFKAAADDYANQQGDPSDIAGVQALIAKLLGPPK